MVSIALMWKNIEILLEITREKHKFLQEV